MATDPVELTRALIRCPSVTPAEAGALTILENLLGDAGFACTRVDRNGIPNLFARWGQAADGQTFGFNGHTDVVPVGDETAWRFDPFGAEVRDGWLYGRGATDMKSGVAAFAAAAVDFVNDTPPDGSVVLAITGDEEGVAADGTVALLDWMKAEGERINHCLVGEPTCPEQLGEMIKIGRRGSLTAFFNAIGVQGHSAYPHHARNPVPAMAALMVHLAAITLDEGSCDFGPSTLAVTAIDTGNPADNVIPAGCQATVNIRFNDHWRSDQLIDMLRGAARNMGATHGIGFEMTTRVSGESFLTPPGDLSDLVAKAVQAETGLSPVLSTSGGTSDARFLRTHCPVVEFGLVGKTMHQANERVEVAQIYRLKAIYSRILRDYFA
ncbi:MAG: succinyl-diaminopimelate desuccinylase [Rhodobacteraceae bacterium]|nr:succinyl-diaminopimelate desuccinylase [Paracoccaceae bacterium]